MHPQTHRSRCKATGPRIHRSAQRAFALNSVLTAPRPAGCRVQIISRASPARIDADHSVNRMSVTTPLTPRPLPCHPCTGTPRPNFRPVTGFKFFSLPSPVSPYFFAGLGIVHGVAAAAKDEIPGLIPAQLRRRCGTRRQLLKKPAKKGFSQSKQPMKTPAIVTPAVAYPGGREGNLSGSSLTKHVEACLACSPRPSFWLRRLD